VSRRAPILRLRDDVAGWMAERGIDQWRPGEMPPEWIEPCATHGWLVSISPDGNRAAALTD